MPSRLFLLPVIGLVAGSFLLVGQSSERATSRLHPAVAAVADRLAWLHRAPASASGIGQVQAKRHTSRLSPGSGPFGSVIGTGTNTVALTFDDGPEPTFTPLLLELLRGAGVRATFCLIGQNAQRYPNLVRAIVADGHTLCNHSWDHNLFLGMLDRDAIRDNLAKANEAITAAAPGVPISYFRAPGGNWTADIVDMASELEMTSLDWTVDPRDWTLLPAASIYAVVMQSSVPGAIILLHDGGGNRRNTIEAVRSLLADMAHTVTFAELPPDTG